MEEVQEVMDLVKEKFENFRKDRDDVKDDILENAKNAVESKSVDSLLSMDESDAITTLDFMIHMVGNDIDKEGKFEISNLIKSNASNPEFKTLLTKLKEI